MTYDERSLGPTKSRLSRTSLFLSTLSLKNEETVEIMEVDSIPLRGRYSPTVVVAGSKRREGLGPAKIEAKILGLEQRFSILSGPIPFSNPGSTFQTPVSDWIRQPPETV